MVELPGMEQNSFLQQTIRLSPYVTELDRSKLTEGLASEIVTGEIGVTLNELDRSAWSITPETSSDRNNVHFSLAVGKFKSENNYHWKAFKSVTILGIATAPGVVIATLYGNESIAKLIIQITDNHPFDLDYFLTKSAGLGEPWKSCIGSIFGPLQGMPPHSYDVALQWTRLTKMLDRRAAGLSARTELLNREQHIAEADSMGKQREKTNQKLAKKVKLAEEKRSRTAPRNVVPRTSSGPASTEKSTGGRSGDVPTTPTATLPGATSSLTGKTSRPKQPVSKSRKPKQVTPAPIPESTLLRCQPGLDDDETPPCTNDVPGSQPEDISREIITAGATSNVGETVIMSGELPGRLDDVLNIMPRVSPPKPPKVLLLSEKEWSANPIVRNEDATLQIPEELETEVVTVVSSKKVEDKAAELRRRALLNEKFTRESDYMYIFGRDQIFELSLQHMEPSDHRSGRIYRDFEKAGAEDIKRNLILANFVKPVLTVMPNLAHRPKDWAECVNAGKFKIINGQHTWHAAKSCLSDAILREAYPSIETMKLWDVQVVWTNKVHHLHALSYKCNEGQNETRHLTSLLRAILHCRVLFEQEGKPPMVRKNASTKKKKAAQNEESAVDLEAKSKYEVNKLICTHLKFSALYFSTCISVFNSLDFISLTPI